MSHDWPEEKWLPSTGKDMLPFRQEKVVIISARKSCYHFGKNKLLPFRQEQVVTISARTSWYQYGKNKLLPIRLEQVVTISARTSCYHFARKKLSRFRKKKKSRLSCAVPVLCALTNHIFFLWRGPLSCCQGPLCMIQICSLLCSVICVFRSVFHQ